MRTISEREARRAFSRILRQAENGSDAVWGQPMAAINPITEFAGNYRVIVMVQRNASGRSRAPVTAAPPDLDQLQIGPRSVDQVAVDAPVALDRNRPLAAARCARTKAAAQQHDQSGGYQKRGIPTCAESSVRVKSGPGQQEEPP